MTERVVPSRRIDRVSAAGLALLEAGHYLPDRYGKSIGRVPVRQATRSEIEAISWLVLWEKSRVAGWAGFVDRYDPHLSDDVREVVMVAGSRRATIELLRFMVGEARALGRRTLGAIDLGNTKMRDVLLLLGHEPTRVVFEAKVK